MDKLPNNKSTDTEKLPHSGNLPEGLKENPVNNFDKTSLEQAYALTDTSGNFVITTPESAKELIETAPKKSKKGLFIGLGATAAGLIVAGGAFFGISAANEAPKSEPVAEAPADPAEPVPSTETETPIEAPVVSTNENDPTITAENEAATLESLRFTSNLSPQELGEKYSENLTRWNMAGATPETFYAWLDAGLPDTNAYAAEIAKINAPTYATALFGEEYVSNTYIGEFVSSAEKANAASIIGFLGTYGDKNMPNSNSLNKEALHGEYKPLSITLISESEEKIVIAVKQQVDINDENTMYAGKLPYDGKISDTYLSYIVNPGAEGSLKISTLDINNTPQS